MLENLQVPSSKIFVWAFIPCRITQQGLISEYDLNATHNELADVFTQLALKWKFQQITLKNMQTVVEEVAASSTEYTPVVLNYCDGFDEIDGYPGLSVIKLLEAKGIIFTGADSNFEFLTISKIRMKQALVEAGVSTAPYEVIYDTINIGGICKKLKTPLIVKPAISSAGIGLSSKSVVHSDEEIYEHIQHLLQEQTELQFILGNIFVERFINGREFTVFIVGSAQQPNQIKVYPPLEFVFHFSLPEFEKFKSHKIHLEVENFLSGKLVNYPLFDKICELGKRAYCAVGGNGYGRVDIRMDNSSQELFVLEVNANCAISSQPISLLFENGQTSVGTIINLSGILFTQLMSEIIAEAFARQSIISHQMSQAI